MKKKIFISFFMAIAVVAVGSISRAAIEIKPGTTAYTSIDVSSAYQLCYDLRANDTTLGNNSLDPHLTLNKDWGAVAYLGASAYGSVRSLYGEVITIDGSTYYSSTKNKSGVINLGRYATQTSSLYNGSAGGSPKNTIKLKDNIGSKYVETLQPNYNESNTKGMALGETMGWYNAEDRAATEKRPNETRGGYWSLYGTAYNGGDFGYGYGTSVLTFRPVIWN